MRKIYLLRPDGKNPDRVLESVKHDIRKYVKRERRRELPEGAHFWDFDCRIGSRKDNAETVHSAELIKSLDALAKAGENECYVEVLAKPRTRQARSVSDDTEDSEVGTEGES